MDGRFDPRYPANMEVWVTDLQNEGYSACGTIRDISASGVCVAVPLALAAGDVVRLDIADSVLYGFVTYSEAEAYTLDTAERDSWRTGIEVQRVLIGDSDLGKLLRQVLNAEMPRVPAESLLQ